MLAERWRTGSYRRRTCEGDIGPNEFSSSDGCSSAEREMKELERRLVLVDGSAFMGGRTVARLIALARPGRGAGGAGGAGAGGWGFDDRRDGVRDIPIAG